MCLALDMCKHTGAGLVLEQHVIASSPHQL